MHATPIAMSRPSPALGRHNDEILAELGFSPAAIAALRTGGAIL